MKNLTLPALKQKPVVFFDFDNTVSTCDVFDDMLVRFSKDKSWIELEKKWKAGKIGSQACLRGQTKSIRITKDGLDKYLLGIKLDPYFKKLVSFLNTKKIRIIVLSDNFDYLLNRILEQNLILGIKIYSNKLKFADNKLIPVFPFANAKCSICGHCKTKNLLANVDKKSIIFYIGDGRSDICPAQCADTVFAKDELLEYAKSRELAFLPYKNLKQVYDYFKRSFS